MTATITSTESSTRSNGVMPPKLGAAGVGSDYRKSVPVEVRLRQWDGRAEGTWHQDIYSERSCFRRAARVVEELVAMGEGERAEMLLAPIDAALMGRTTETTVQAILASAKADCDENGAEAAYHANPCKATAEALIRASIRDRVRAEIREQKLRDQWGIK